VNRPVFPIGNDPEIQPLVIEVRVPDLSTREPEEGEVVDTMSHTPVQTENQTSLEAEDREQVPAEVRKSRSKGQSKRATLSRVERTGAEKTYDHISLSAPKLSDVLGDHQGLGVLWAFRGKRQSTSQSSLC